MSVADAKEICMDVAVLAALIEVDVFPWQKKNKEGID